MSTSSLSVAVDLRSGFGAIRAQGERPTCAAFAASGCHAYSIDADSPELSVEYAFYHAVARTVAKDRTTGVNFAAMSAAIAGDGQPAESAWPYIPHLGPADHWSPPANVGTIYRGGLNRISCDLVSVRAELESARPVFVITDISKSFYFTARGAIVNASSAERREGTHAVIALGFGHLDAAVCYLIRNSWGPSWGTDGYAWLHEDYLEPRLRVAGVFS